VVESGGGGGTRSNSGDAEDGGALARRGRRTRAAVTRGTTVAACRMAATVHGALAGGARRPINRLGWMGRFERTGACVGVWSVGPNHEGDERGAHLASLGGLRIINID
jgi:hypothetical protein